MTTFEHPRRKAVIALALLGFYLTSSTAMATFLFIVGALNYLSILATTLRQLPSTPAKLPATPTLVPKTVTVNETQRQTLHFEPSDNPAKELQRVRLVIQQNAQKPPSSQQTSSKISDYGYRTKPHPSC